MQEQSFKPIADKMMSTFGITLTEILESDLKTPDYIINVKGEKALLELKIKEDDPKQAQILADKLKQGDIVTTTTPMGSRNRLSAIINNAATQLSEYDPTHDAFHIVWLHCGGQDPEIHWDRFHATLYGTETMFSLRCSTMLRCYFFRESSFFRWKDKLDAALLTTLKGGQLCINSLAPNSNRFRKSKIVERFKSCLFDPAKEEEKKALIADCDIDRKRTGELINFLKMKYKIDHLQVMSLSNVTGTMKLQSQ